MKLFKVVTFSLVFLIVAYFLAVFVIFPPTVKELPASVRVERVLGFISSNEGLLFGSVPPGARGIKNITFDSSGVLDFVTLSTEGNISSWVTVSDNNFFIFGGDKKVIQVFVSISEYAPLDFNYTGIFKVATRKIV